MGALSEADRFDCTGPIGTELRGVQLAKLDDTELDQVKRLAAERCVVFFRDQAMTLSEQVATGARMGTLHVHPTFREKAAEGAEGHREVLIIHGDADSTAVPGEGWHSDVSCDAEPPALSMLRIEVTPPVGGDTLFSSMYGAYEALSPSMQAYLLTLRAVHSGKHAGPAYGYKDLTADYPVNEHPLVRTHPISGRKALYVNSGFTSHVVGLTKRESDALLGMLFDHVAYGVQWQVRFHWEPNSVAIWDNRCVQHHATWDYFPATRHGYRVTTVGERPFL